MTDEQSPRSGSRWEPDPDAGDVPPAGEPVSPPVDTAQQPAQADAEGAHPPPYVEGTGPADSPAPRRTWRNRIGKRGAAVAGAAAALVLVSGLGGFAIGHVVGEHDHHFGPGDFRSRDVGFTDRGPLPPPGFGPGRPPYGDDDQDGDGSGPGVPDQGTVPDDGGSQSANPNQQSGTDT